VSPAQQALAEAAAAENGGPNRYPQPFCGYVDKSNNGTGYGMIGMPIKGRAGQGFPTSTGPDLPPDQAEGGRDG
jgi:hypothetical protein